MRSLRVCDGWDVSTEVGVLHFTSEPTAETVAAMVAQLSAPPEPLPVEPVEAEDGTLI